MSLSTHTVLTQSVIRHLESLSKILDKAAAHAQARNFDVGVLLNARLAPDMFALTRQVQIATDMAKNGAARLAGVDPLKFEDNETSFAELHARIDRAIEYIKGFKADQIDGSETRAITLKMRSGEQHFEGQGYLLHFVTPNLFFHCTTAYAILREAGADLGKTDFIGKA